jgi:hypothetical protein
MESAKMMCLRGNPSLTFVALSIALASATSAEGQNDGLENGVPQSYVGPCSFSPGATNLVVQCANAFTVSLDRANGALTALYDASGRLLSRGSRNGCLFGAANPPLGTYCGSCGCDGVDMAMVFTWHEADNALEMTFSPSPPDPTSTGWAARVTLTAQPLLSPPAFDLALTLLEGPGAGSGFTELLFPSEVLFESANLSALYLPLAPGVALLPPFFAQRKTSSWSYPSSFAFAQWVQLSFDGGSSLTLHDLSGPDSVVPVESAVTPASEAKYSNSTYFLSSSIPVSLMPGCAAFSCAIGANGTVTRRFTLSASALSPLDSIYNYSVANGFLQGSNSSRWPSPPFRSVRHKLSSSVGGSDLLKQMFQAPLLKMDAMAVGLPFDRYVPEIVASLPAPALIHICAYSRCGSPETPGFDCNYPDMLPPATPFGSSCDLQELFLRIAALGSLSMPYFNPTWWDMNSPTLLNLTRAQGNLSEAAALNASGLPIEETYPDSPPRSGIVVCPRAPFVRARIAIELQALSSNASGAPPVKAPCDESQPLPSSFVFEDQVGARFPSLDDSPFEAQLGAFGFELGLLEHAQAHEEVGLHTEQGFDRLARSVIGFHGSVLQYEAAAPWGAENTDWRPEPLFAASGLRAIVSPYQHNLAGEIMARTVSLACWSLSMGFHLSLDLSSSAARQNASWTQTIASFQRVAASRFADYRAVSVSEVPFDGRNISFSADDFTPPLEPFYSTTAHVVWQCNASASDALPLILPGGSGVSILTQGGCVAYGESGDTVAGFFDGLFQGAPLAPGIHAIVIDATCSLLTTDAVPQTICVEHTLGQDTDVTVSLTAALRSPTNIRVAALGEEFAHIADLPFAVSSRGDAATFLASAQVNGVQARMFVIAPAPAVAKPVSVGRVRGTSEGQNDGLVGLFVGSCPTEEGWDSYESLQGRLILATNNSFQAGDAVGFSLSDGEDRQHVHAISGQFTFSSKHIAAAGGTNTHAALHGAQPLLGFLNFSSTNGTGIPFLQLTSCRLSNSSVFARSLLPPLVLPKGAVSFWDPAVATEGCEAISGGWAALQPAAGRFIAVSGSSALLGRGYVPSSEAPLERPGTQFPHTHGFRATVSLGSTDFSGIDGCCNDNPSSDGEQSTTGDTSSAATALPYLSLLTCNKTTGAAGGAPTGAPTGFILISVAGLPCPAGWQPLADEIGGRFVVGTPAFGVPSRAFGGEPISGDGGGGAWQATHAHNFTLSFDTTPAGIGLASGCCAHGYGEQGSYTARGLTAGPDVGGEIPWLLVQACVQGNATSGS